jgi:hypothetical protein
MTSYGAAGRWGGRLTRRPLPEDDAEIDALSDEQREQLVTVWLGRAASERRVADAFEVVRDALIRVGAPGEVSALATRAIDDEFRHEELSRRVASCFAGSELEPPPRLALTVPEHPGAAPELLPTLHIVGHCAMNETFASAFLEATLATTTAPLARAAVQELLADEIDHARIGWSHLARLDPAQRAVIGPWLLPMVRANLRMWRTTPRPYPVDGALHRHGAPSALVVEAALIGAITDVIAPGLEHFQLPTEPIHAWLASGAPTHD